MNTLRSWIHLQGRILGGRRGRPPPHPESVFKESIICEIHNSYFFNLDNFFNEIKLINNFDFLQKFWL